MEIDLNNLSNDPESLLEAFNKLESGAVEKTEQEGATSAGDEGVVEGSGADEKAAPSVDSQEADGQQGSESDPDGVATKDGKRVIPYSVLKSERGRASRAEQIAREAQERVAALESQLAAVSQGAKTGEGARTEPQNPAVDDLSSDDLEALKEDFPTVYKAVMASMAAAKALETKLQPVEERMRSAEAERERSAVETVQDAIDSVPKLAHIQATNAGAFELAKQFDATLRSQSAWADRPLSERFAKVAEMVESAIGPINVPGQKQASPTNAEDLAKAARDKAAVSAKASRGGSAPVSLSEFPAGRPPAQDERESAEQLNQQQLYDKFSRMSPEEMDSYFRNL